MVNLTTLARDIVAAILDETLPPEVPLFDLASGDAVVVRGAAEIDSSVRGQPAVVQRINDHGPGLAVMTASASDLLIRTVISQAL